MLFNSFSFLFIFLPLVLFTYHKTMHSIGPKAAFGFLSLSSLFFYGWWNPPYLFLLLGSILFNFFVGRSICKNRVQHQKRSRLLLILGILFNISLLAYFKYTAFALSTWNMFSGHTFNIPMIVLPLAISFITFQKIAFLMDCKNGEIKDLTFSDFLLFVAFFPQLVAGPIVHFRDIMPQFKSLNNQAKRESMFTQGVTLLAIGLFKKTVIADTMAVSSNNVYEAIHSGMSVSLLDSWVGVFSYSFQIYFDFSGYSDMALGIACLFGIRLPINFLSPYKATGFIDFWQRWHITLSHFLRDYIYIPLGGNRMGKIRQAVNITLTMFIGGLWHGANWTFVLWGGLHGLFICLNHLLRASSWSSLVHPKAAMGITFVLITLLWIPFRAENLNDVILMLQCLFTTLPAQTQEVISLKISVFWLILVSFWVFFTPSSMEVMNLAPAIKSKERHSVIALRPSAACAVIIALLFFASFVFMQSNIGSSFIYFDF